MGGYMFDKIINLYEKYKGIILYGIFGILTTVINFVLYFLFVNLICPHSVNQFHLNLQRYCSWSEHGTD